MWNTVEGADLQFDGQLGLSAAQVVVVARDAFAQLPLVLQL